MERKTVGELKVAENELITLEDIIEASIRWKWLIAAVFVVFSLGSIIYYNLQENIYSATIKLLYNKKSNEISLYGGGFSTSKSRELGNELEIIKSRQFGLRVAEALVESLKVNPDYVKYPTFAPLEGNPNPNRVLGRVLGGRDASSPRALDIILISFQSQDPAEAALIANVFGAVYIDNDIKSNRSSQILVKDFIKKQLDERDASLKVAEKSLQDYMIESGVITIDTESQSVVSNLANIETRINESRIDIGINEERIKSATRQLEELEPQLAELSINVIDDYAQLLQKRIATIEAERDYKFSTQNPNDYAVKLELDNLDRQSKNLRQQLEKRLSDTYSKSVPIDVVERTKDLNTEKILAIVAIDIENYKIEKLTNLFKDFEKKFDAIPAKNVEFARLERARRSAEELYLILEKKFQEALIAEQQVTSSIMIIDPAIPSYNPVEPQRTKMITVFSLLGLIVGIVVAVTVKKMDNRIHKIDDLEKIGINVLGQIPMDIEIDNTGNLITDVSTIIQEMYRQVAINVNYILNVKKSEDGKIILTTSTVPKEGKTFSAINLGATFADMGNKVLIIDGDLRRPNVDKNLQIEKVPGLTDFLNENTEIFTRKVESYLGQQLDVIPSGTLPISPAPIISSEEFIQLLGKFRKQYDIIILDTPPTLSVGDVQIYAEYVDGIAYVVGAETVYKTDFLRHYKMLFDKFRNIQLGVILNKVRKENLSAQGSYYYYYYSSEAKDMKKKRKRSKSVPTA